eukprot:scaffold17506_cov55-Phaeocystis_antarctica.AAC.3
MSARSENSNTNVAGFLLFAAPFFGGILRTRERSLCVGAGARGKLRRGLNRGRQGANASSDRCLFSLRWKAAEIDILRLEREGTKLSGSLFLIPRPLVARRLH